jgi:hypothetical protein
MKFSFDLSRSRRALAILSAVLGMLASLRATPLNGDSLTITGDSELQGDNLTFGTANTSDPGISFTYADGTTATITMASARNAINWEWYHNSGSGAVISMKLDANNQLLLYNAAGTTPGITLNPTGTSAFVNGITIGGSSVLTSAVAATTYLPITLPIVAGTGTNSLRLSGATNAIGTGSLAVGSSAVGGGASFSTANYSVALGNSTVDFNGPGAAADYAFAVGQSNVIGSSGASANFSAALGKSLIKGSGGASVNNSFASGESLVEAAISGGVAYSTAMGKSSIKGATNTSANYSTATGNSAIQAVFYFEPGMVSPETRTAAYGLASGLSSILGADYAMATGKSTVEYGDYATAMGNSKAQGNYSTSAGEGTIAQGYGQTVLGRFNTPQGTKTSWVATDELLTVGNGTSDTVRSNAFTVKKNGDAIFTGTVRVPPRGDVSMGEFTAE